MKGMRKIPRKVEETPLKKEWSRKSAKVPSIQLAFWQTEKAQPHTKFPFDKILHTWDHVERQFRSEYRLN